MSTVPRTPREAGPCRVCGCPRVWTDEAVDRGPVLLAECARCQHRWTASLDPASRAAGPLRAAPLAIAPEDARVA